MKFMNKGWLLFTGIIFVALLTGCMAGGSDEKTGDENNATGEESDLEEKVVVYSPHGTDILGDFQKRFEEEYGVKMEFLDMGSQEILDRVRSEDNNTQADVWWGAPEVNFNQAKEEGLLAAYKPSYADTLADTYHDEDWMWSGTSMTPQVILYNNKNVSAEDSPKDWDDLLKDKWKDDIIIRYPLASGGMRTVFSAMIYNLDKDDPEKGYEWLEKLDTNTKEYAANPEIMYNQVAKGVGNISIWNMPDTVELIEEKGYPFGYNLPESGTPVITEGIAIIDDAPHPEAAEAFYEFVNTPEAAQLLAERYYRIPTRDDIEELPDWIEETDIEPMDVDWELFEEKEDEWMDYWDSHIKNTDKDKSDED